MRWIQICKVNEKAEVDEIGEADEIDDTYEIGLYFTW